MVVCRGIGRSDQRGEPDPMGKSVSVPVTLQCHLMNVRVSVVALALPRRRRKKAAGSCRQLGTSWSTNTSQGYTRIESKKGRDEYTL